MTSPPRPTFDTAASTHPGKLRADNEDAYLDRVAAGLWAVADGMGGHQAGQFASRTLIECLARIEPQESAAHLLARCEASVVEANARLFEAAAAQGAIIGTTLAALLAYGADYACVWSGDSRIYRIRGGAIALMSRDHTEVQDLVERGILTAEEGRASSRRNIITRAIGVRTHAELEITQGTLADGDVFLLCTDGLTNHLGDAELCAAAAGGPPSEACQSLVGLALERGGTDNITLIVLRYRAPAPPGRGAGDGDATLVDAIGTTVQTW